MLSPSLSILTRLLESPDSITDKEAPVMTYLRSPSTTRQLSTLHGLGVVPYSGDLSVLDRARVSNWIAHHIPNAKKNLQLWFAKAPYAHALTILIAARHHVAFMTNANFPKTGTASEQEHYVLLEAWDYQMRAVADDIAVADVDLEALKSLEERMFEVSKAAGTAGYWQWGLDAGDHQECWDPYQTLPTSWHYPDAELDTEEHHHKLEVCDIRKLLH